MDEKTGLLPDILSGVVSCSARLVDGTIQLWDAKVRLVKADKIIALFRCTQLFLYPKAAS